jgi:hypothetical protein
MTAEDPKTTESRPVDTVQVTVIGTKDASKMESGVVAVTPGLHEPNLVVKVISPVVAVGVRFGYDWCQAFLGSAIVTKILAGEAVPIVPAVSVIRVAALGATVIAVIGLLKNAMTIFSGLEKKFPLESGNV